jgi:hypothetical protein
MTRLLNIRLHRMVKPLIGKAVLIAVKDEDSTLAKLDVFSIVKFPVIRVTFSPTAPERFSAMLTFPLTIGHFNKAN